MASKQILLHDKAAQGLFAEVKIRSGGVKITLGAEARTVMLQWRFGRATFPSQRIVVAPASGELPRRTVAGGTEAAPILDTACALEGIFGLDATSGDYGDLFVTEIIDSGLVTRLARQNATSVACLSRTTDCVISDRPSHDTDETERDMGNA